MKQRIRCHQFVESDKMVGEVQGFQRCKHFLTDSLNQFLKSSNVDLTMKGVAKQANEYWLLLYITRRKDTIVNVCISGEHETTKQAVEIDIGTERGGGEELEASKILL